MGLSAMEDIPDMTQQMRFANIYGQTHNLAPNVWVGETNLNGLGLGDGTPNDITQGFNAAGNFATQLAQSGLINQLRGGKNKKTTAPMPVAHPMIQATPTTDTGHSNMSKYLLLGGLAIGAAVILYVVLKKKKKNDGGGI